MALAEVALKIYQVKFDDSYIKVLLLIKNNPKSLEIYLYVPCQ